MDFSQLLRGFNEVVEVQEEDLSKKVNTFPVVARNYNRLKEIIRNHSNEEITNAFFIVTFSKSCGESIISLS